MDTSLPRWPAADTGTSIVQGGRFATNDRFGLEERMPSGPGSGQSGDSASAVKPAKAYLDLRKVVLRRTAADFGLHPTAALPNVWGALVEVGFDTGSATLMAAADGSTSLYLSNGGATIGGGAVPEIADATQHLLALVEGWLRSFAPATGFPLPRRGRARFVALTFDGARTAEAGLEELSRGDHPLTPIFRASEIVLSAMERLQAATEGAGSG